MGIYANIACDMPRDPRMVAAGWQARAVYTEAVLYCRENLTDGIIDRLTLVCWMPDMPVRARIKWLDALAAVGALEKCSEGWKWPDKVWQTWNPSKSEVVAKREAEAQRKADYRARRKPVPDVSGNVPTGQRVTATQCPRQPEPEPKGEPEPEGKNPSVMSPNGFNSDPTPTPEGQGSSPRRNMIVSNYVRIAREAATVKGESIKSEIGFTRYHADKVTADPNLTRWADMFPTAPPDAVAAWLHGDKGSMRYYPRADELATVTELPRKDTT